jgi:hypothetical protein
MPEEGEQIQVEQQSSAGKWILVVLAIVLSRRQYTGM